VTRRRPRDSGFARRHDAGFALVIVLWGLVLLSLIIAQVGAAGRSEATIARNLLANAQTEAAADAAVYEAAFRLVDRSPRGWIADGGTRQLLLTDARVWLTLQDDAGKLNPNAATQEQLAALLAAVGAPGDRARALARAMVDWRGGQGAEAPELSAAAYRAAGLPYLPPGRPFARLDEVGLVVGMTPELFERLAPHLSLAQRGMPDLSVADRVVALALGALPGAVRRQTAAPYGVHAVTVIARAEGPGGAAFTRIAVLQLGIGPALPLGYAVIDWQAGSAD
jgi:general secretion pathway protein K